MLPPEFSEVLIDAQGREFVLHRPSGVRYYVKERAQRPQEGRSARAPSTVVHLVREGAQRAARPEMRERPPVVPSRPSPAFLAALAHVPKKPAPAPAPKPIARARARFIPNSSPAD
jgi:hypothetical protein